ncbi:N-acetylmuramoyl-L-alanine amidase [Paracoccus halophilus]|uniref:N-acetylmuramoyl-L-alanine amidase n=1 Tax=Paracoccus halophilus TaxID=376733 RepID=A0A099F8D7_9RHOB|nr:N-acetylmuramoyl-L-alanine amidase [Paracoccus halophilus]KGJ06794.1 N-acetylmuramoyl-L-alanine amidase [Paracoccus halophilus]SFA41536.1 N-acetylmuramoyl-L-alanine amidase [Paracoccus halophilus]
MSLSPNHGDRRGQRPELVVIHYTGMADAASARARLCDPASEVSAHWLIHEHGLTEALVPEGRRAWHAGAGCWQGREDVNSRSIGIELVNPGDRPFPEPQMAALEDLLAAILRRWAIGPQGVIGHSDLAPERKSDPGPRFDWRRLALRRLAIWPDGPGSDLPLADSLARIGYPDSPARLAAFRLRFRPWAEGPEDATDRRLAAALAYSAS